MQTTNRKIRVLVVDDSAVARSVIIQGLSASPRIEVVGYAVNAMDAKTKLQHLSPDVMTLDVEMPGITGANLMQILEPRLDNVVFRLGFAKTRKEARQIVTHGHIMVNGKRVDIPSYRVRPGDLVSVRPKSKELLVIKSALVSNEGRLVPAWLEEIGAGREESDKPDTPDETSLKVNITVGDRTITATMEDNAAGRDFLSRLPLEVTLNDYNNTTEKIFYPGPALTTEGVTRGCAPTPGDITIYVPWGNVAIFCKSWSHSNDLIKIGRIDGDGIEALNIGGDIAVKFERQ